MIELSSNNELNGIEAFLLIVKIRCYLGWFFVFIRMFIGLEIESFECIFTLLSQTFGSLWFVSTLQLLFVMRGANDGLTFFCSWLKKSRIKLTDFRKILFQKGNITDADLVCESTSYPTDSFVDKSYNNNAKLLYVQKLRYSSDRFLKYTQNQVG